MTEGNIKAKVWPGNDQSDAAIFHCSVCGEGEMCDVCHLHDEPRGRCTECPQLVKEPRQ